MITKQWKFKTDINNLWSYISEVEKQKLWLPGVVDFKFLPEVDKNQPKPFVIYLQEGKKIKEYNGYTTLSNPPHALTIVMYSDIMKTTTSYELSQDGDITTMKYQSNTEIKGLFMKILFAIMYPILANLMLSGAVKKLKKLVEKNN